MAHKREHREQGEHQKKYCFDSSVKKKKKKKRKKEKEKKRKERKEICEKISEPSSSSAPLRMLKAAYKNWAIATKRVNAM